MQSHQILTMYRSFRTELYALCCCRHRITSSSCTAGPACQRWPSACGTNQTKLYCFTESTPSSLSILTNISTEIYHLRHFVSYLFPWKNRGFGCGRPNVVKWFRVLFASLGTVSGDGFSFGPLSPLQQIELRIYRKRKGPKMNCFLGKNVGHALHVALRF